MSCIEYEEQKTQEFRYEKECQIETKKVSMQDFQESLLMWNIITVPYSLKLNML